MAERRHPDEDLLVEVVLGQADLPTRDAVTAHLGSCDPCRRAYDDLAGAVELVLPAVPRVPPPTGFEARVLDRLREGRGAVPTPAAGGGPRRRGPLLAVAAGLVGLAAGLGVGTMLDGDDSAALAPPAALASHAVALTTADGRQVGAVSPSRSGRDAVLVVDVTDGRSGRSYVCRLVLADGSTRDVGEWELSADRPNSWVVPDPGVRAVELVAESGTVWATARL